jgi:uncharacterized repeat protein (TIGR02543 family)
MSLIVASLILASCGSAFQRADLESFVETGLTIVALRSSNFESGSSSLQLLPSGKEVTGNLQIINPKAFDVSYNLTLSDNSIFSSRPLASPVPSDPTHLTFTFTLDPSAEHKTITFTLGKYVASINRNYDDDSISMLCDSPPNAARGLTTAEDESAKAFLAFILPAEKSDDDLSSIKVTWRRLIGGTEKSASYAASELVTAPAADPFADGNSLNRYFCPDTDPGYAYAFTLVLVDAGGQVSASVSATSVPHPYALVYAGNGNEGGEPPAAANYNVEGQFTVADCGTLYKSGYTFVYWNSAADGSGTVYRPGSVLAMGAADLTLYAVWAQNGIFVSFDIGTQAIAFSASSTTVARGATLSVSCANPTLAAGGSGWEWYVDGSLAEGQSGPSFSWSTIGLQPGQYEIGCRVAYQGLSYSGSFRATVTY